MSYKDFDQVKDVSSQLSVVNEVMALTGSFFSGTNYYTKNYINITSGSAVSGGFFSTVYDGSPTSISSSALLDVTYGHSSQSLLAGYSETFLDTEKQRVYQQMAAYLLGDKNSIFSFNSIRYHELFFLCFKRRIFKDEVAKGYTTINIQVSGNINGDGLAMGTLNLTDAGAASSYAAGYSGDEAPLYSGSTQIGRVYYNAGIIAFATGVFLAPSAAASLHWSGSTANKMNMNQCTITGNLDNIMYGFRQRVNNIQFNNQTNLHNQIFFCRALNNEFNYSSNATFLDSDGRILPTSGTDNQTRTYPTTVGLYDINNNCLAVAKLSEPIKKSPDSEVTVRVKISY